jgi:hypothetical protein
MIFTSGVRLKYSELGTIFCGYGIMGRLLIRTSDEEIIPNQRPWIFPKMMINRSLIAD